VSHITSNKYLELDLYRTLMDGVACLLADVSVRDGKEGRKQGGHVGTYLGV
jgi:hypothetical protein